MKFAAFILQDSQTIDWNQTNKIPISSYGNLYQQIYPSSCHLIDPIRWNNAIYTTPLRI